MRNLETDLEQIIKELQSLNEQIKIIASTLYLMQKQGAK